MIYFPSKVFAEGIDEQDLMEFLARKHRENRFLDYKLKYEGWGRDARKEFLKDVTALANSDGGNLIIGVEEVEEDGVILPGELKGIDDGPSIVNSLRDLCNDAIDPRINGLEIRDIALSNKKWAIIVYVPLSLRRPHMAGLQKSFYIRRDDRSVPMTTHEVKGAVLEIVDLEKTILGYKERIESEMMNIFLGGHFGFAMHAIPLLLEEGQVNTADERIRKILWDQSLNNKFYPLISERTPAPTLYGIMGESGRQTHLFQTYLHNNGYIGLVFDYKELIPDANDRRNKIVQNEVRELFLSFIRLCRLVTVQAEISSPYQVHCEFKNAAGSTHFHPRPKLQAVRGSLREWALTELKLPPIRVDSFDNPEAIANHFHSRLRNAFGLE